MTQTHQQQSRIVDILKEFTAGLFGGWAQVIVGQPFDTIKVRLQAQNPANPTYTGPLDCLQKLIKTEGPQGLYKGTTSPLLGVGIAMSIQFGVSENIKKVLRPFSDTPHRLELPLVFISGGVAGGTNTFVQTAVEHFRIKMQLQTAGTQQLYRSSIDCAFKIYRQYGFRGVFKGFTPTFYRESIGGAFYFGIFEMVSRMFYTSDQSSKDCPTHGVLLAGALAGNIFWITTYPFDVVKSRIQGDSFENPKYSGMIDCFRQTSKGGLKAFFPGFLVCMMRAAPANAVTFLTFQQAMKLFNPVSGN